MSNIKSKDNFRVLIVYPNLTMMLVPSIAIALFTKILRNEGYQIELFDTTHYVGKENSSPQNRVKYLQARKFNEEESLKVKIKTDLLGDFRKKVMEVQPDIMLFSVVEDVFLQSLKMLQEINDLNIPHLVGGVFPTAAPDVCMSFPEIRMICIGEGEKTIIEVVEALRTGKEFKNIPGIWYRTSEGDVQRNPLRNVVDINEVIPDFDLFDESRFYRPMGGKIFKAVPIETYRGCPYSCAYCNSPMQKRISTEHKIGTFLRKKNIARVREELSCLITRYNPELFYFIDDSFLARTKKEIYEFCRMYKEFNVPFWLNTRPENCDPEILQSIKDVNCYRISFGIECGNEDFRKNVLGRNVSNKEIINKFKIIAESGIAYSLNLIIGFPFETRELVMDTVELVRFISGYDTLTVSIFTPYHGTILRATSIQNGWLAEDSITKHTTASSMLNMPPPYLSSKEIDGLMRVVPLYCYFPKQEWDQIRRAEIDDEEGNRIFELYSGIYQEKFLKLTQDERKEILVSGGTGCSNNPKDSFRAVP